MTRMRRFFGLTRAQLAFQDEIDFARVGVHRGNAHLHLVAQAVDFAGYATF